MVDHRTEVHRIPGVAAPGHVVVRPDECVVGALQLPCGRLRQVDDVRRDAALACGTPEVGHQLGIARQDQQGDVRAEPIVKVSP